MDMYSVKDFKEVVKTMKVVGNAPEKQSTMYLFLS